MTDGHASERVPYYTAWISGVQLRIDAETYWEGDCVRAKIGAWVLRIAAVTVELHFPVENRENRGSVAIALTQAKDAAERMRVRTIGGRS